MDLKTVEVSFSGSIGELNGTGLELLTYLREVALTDLGGLIDLENGVGSGEFTDSEELVGDEFGNEEEEDSFEREPLEEIAELPETSDVIDAPVDVSITLDSTIGTKIEKFSTVIKYFDSIIATNGVVDDTNVIMTMIDKFKLLDGVYNSYGDFTYSTSFTTA
ncbi:hypothetical protein P3U41_05790 [Mammaliicoccus sciuri]|uniref:hypothetical protein n=1 Tax=Mammaliicoccus sciuri TaxID=1296 RepID=UPI002B25D0A0|nr:hypothetical protein [Mammaliicoccus sciuri]WQL34281.1 hypothetical protein P3U41_05790 [Mammaliicoccus sciuri]WQL61220.1 hypothetical protein P3T96_05790 [Mammaliicoccus sciuri]